MAITFVQQQTTPTRIGSNSPTVTLPASATVGNTVIIWMSCPAADTISISGSSMVSSWSSVNFVGTVDNLYIFYGVVTGASQTVVTLTATGSSPVCVGAISEYSGLANPSVLDKSQTATASAQVSSLANTGFTTTNANDLLFTACIIGSTETSITTPSGYTPLNQNLSNPAGAAGYEILTSTGSTAPSWSWSATTARAVSIVIALEGVSPSSGKPYKHKPIIPFKSPPKVKLTPQPVKRLAQLAQPPGKVPIKIVKDPRIKHFKFPPFRNSRVTTTQGRARLSPASNVLFFSGFEIGSDAEWPQISTGAGDTISVNTATVNPNGGGYSFKTISTTTPQIFVAQGFSNQPTCYTRMYINIASIAASITTQQLVITEYDGPIVGTAGFICIITDGSGNPSLQLYYSAGGVTFTQVGSNYPISTNTWYCIEHRLTLNSATGISEMRVNKQVVASGSGLNTGTGGIGTLAIEQFAYTGTPTTNATIYFDDILVRTDQYPGYGVCIARQGTAGTPTYDQWTKNGQATAALCWSETPYNATNNCTGTANQSQTMLVASFSSAGSGAEGPGTIIASSTINACKTGMVGKYTTPGNTFRIRRLINGAITDTPIILNSTDTFYADTDTYVAPSSATIFGVGPWTTTLANLNSSQIGATLANTEAVQVEDMWLLVDYTTAASGILPKKFRPYKFKFSAVNAKQIHKSFIKLASRPSYFIRHRHPKSLQINKTITSNRTSFIKLKNKIQPPASALGLILRIIKHPRKQKYGIPLKLRISKIREVLKTVSPFSIPVRLIHRTNLIKLGPKAVIKRRFSMKLLRLIQPPSFKLSPWLKIVKNPRKLRFNITKIKLGALLTKRLNNKITLPSGLVLKIVKDPRRLRFQIAPIRLGKLLTKKLGNKVQPPASNLGVLLRLVKKPKRVKFLGTARLKIARLRLILRALNPTGFPLKLVHRTHIYRTRLAGPSPRRFPMKLLRLVQPPSANLGIVLRLVHHIRKAKYPPQLFNKRIFMLRFLRLAGRPSVASAGVWLKVVLHPKKVKFALTKIPAQASWLKRIRRFVAPTGFPIRIVKDSRLLKFNITKIKLVKSVLKKLENKIQPPSASLAPWLHLVKHPRLLKYKIIPIKLGRLLTKKLGNKITLPSGIWLRIVKDPRKLRFNITKGSHGTLLFRKLNNKIQPPSANLGILLRIIKDPRLPKLPRVRIILRRSILKKYYFSPKPSILLHLIKKSRVIKTTGKINILMHRKNRAEIFISQVSIPLRLIKKARIAKNLTKISVLTRKKNRIIIFSFKSSIALHLIKRARVLRIPIKTNLVIRRRDHIALFPIKPGFLLSLVKKRYKQKLIKRSIYRTAKLHHLFIAPSAFIIHKRNKKVISTVIQRNHRIKSRTKFMGGSPNLLGFIRSRRHKALVIPVSKKFKANSGFKHRAVIFAHSVIIPILLTARVVIDVTLIKDISKLLFTTIHLFASLTKTIDKVLNTIIRIVGKLFPSKVATFDIYAPLSPTLTLSMPLNNNLESSTIIKCPLTGTLNIYLTVTQ